jgi:hypothetical protein
MTESRRKPDKPDVPSYSGGEDERPPDIQPNDPVEPGGDVREPPPPGTAGTEEKFPRKGDQSPVLAGFPRMAIRNAPHRQPPDRLSAIPPPPWPHG